MTFFSPFPALSVFDVRNCSVVGDSDDSDSPWSVNESSWLGPLDFPGRRDTDVYLRAKLYKGRYFALGP